MSSERRDLWAARWARGHPGSLWTWFLPGLHRSGKDEGGEQLTAVAATAYVVPPSLAPLTEQGEEANSFCLGWVSWWWDRFVSMNLIHMFFMFEYRIGLFHAQGYLETLLQKAVTRMLGNPRNGEYSCLCNSALLYIWTTHCLIPLLHTVSFARPHFLRYTEQIMFS